MKNKIYIGVDPGKQTGLCVIKNNSLEVAQITTVSPREFLSVLDDLAGATSKYEAVVQVWLEDHRSNPMHAKREQSILRQMGRGVNLVRALRAGFKVGRSTGQVDAYVAMYEEVIEFLHDAGGYPLFLYTQKPDTSGKRSHKDLTVQHPSATWPRTNQHERDALRLARLAAARDTGKMPKLFAVHKHKRFMNFDLSF